MRFTKMHGIGNDFVMVDAIRDPLPPGDLPTLARRVNDRRLGIGGDGLILLEQGDIAPFRMRMFNPDGSESEMCGNGIRCLGRFAKDRGHTAEGAIPVETGAGILRLDLLESGQVRVDMGPARLARGEIGMAGAPEEQFIDQPIDDRFQGTAVSMGNPHLVVFTDEAEDIDLKTEGGKLERHALFLNRTNVHFVKVLGENRLLQRTWERGAGATLACGTGACAVGVAAFLTNRAGRCSTIELPGGTLEIEYREDGHVFMTGPAETVFEGELNL